MYLGKMVELTESSKLYVDPKHPYTRALLSAVPIADPEASAQKERIMLKGDVPSPVNHQLDADLQDAVKTVWRSAVRKNLR